MALVAEWQWAILNVESLTCATRDAFPCDLFEVPIYSTSITGQALIG